MTELRKMEKTDIPVCGEIFYAAFFGAVDRLLPETSEEYRRTFNYERYFSRFIEDKDKYAFCIIGNGQTVGFIAALEIPSVNDAYTLYIDNFAVAPEYQQHGYGSEAMRQFLDMFPKSTTKRLQTSKNRPAYKMYEKLGFMDVDMRVMEFSDLYDMLAQKRVELEQQNAELKAKLKELEHERKRLKKGKKHS